MKLKILNKTQGFSLIEVIITMAILSMFLMMTTGILKNNISLKKTLIINNRTIKRLNFAMNEIAKDIEQAFLVQIRDIRYTDESKFKTEFKIEKNQDSDKLSLTSFNGEIAKNKNKLRYVIYEIKTDEKNPKISHLYRGITNPPLIDDDPPKMKLLVENIKSIKFQPWNNKRKTFRDDRWNSKRQRKLPYMVKITIETWKDNLFQSKNDDNIEKLSSIIYLNYAKSVNDDKRVRNNTVKYN